jgi:dihydroorotate dehydrogenase electron transfer subunit
VYLAEECLRRGISAALVAGFRNAARVFAPELLPPEVEYVVATDDGSRGFHGFAADAAREHLAWADQIFACGPTPMLRSVAKLGLDREKVQLSLEERMACGLGACLGCVVETRRGLQRVCRDGPVFGLAELGW